MQCVAIHLGVTILGIITSLLDLLRTLKLIRTLIMTIIVLGAFRSIRLPKQWKSDNIDCVCIYFIIILRLLLICENYNNS